MTLETMMPPVAMGDGIVCLPSLVPVPGLGTLASNSFVIDAAEPVVVDTGVPPLAGQFMTQLAEVMAPARVRWIWLTHMDPDHVGGLDALLAAAPEARIVTNGLGAAKLSMRGMDPMRVHVMAPGDGLDIGCRALMPVRPPVYDAAETMGLFDPVSRSLFAADSFASFVAGDGSSMDEADLATGMLSWARVDNPWLADMDPERLGCRLRQLHAMRPRRVLTAHLPPQWQDLGPLAAMLCDVQATLAHDQQPHASAMAELTD